MKIMIDEDIIIFLNNEYLKSIDLENKKSLESLIKHINYKYNIELSGYYFINIYQDKNSGIIVEIKKEDLEYIDYLSNEIEMNIKVIENSFLYKLENLNYLYNIKDKFILYKYLDNFYLKPQKVSEIELGIIIENSEIIYGNKAEKIISQSKIIKPEVIV